MFAPLVSNRHHWLATRESFAHKVKAEPQTHTPHLGIPGVEPAGEGERLVALFDEDDGRVGVAARRVAAQVRLRALPRLLGLGFVGQVSNPQENLRARRNDCFVL